MVKNRISSQYVFGYQKFILYPEDYKVTKSGKKKVQLPELVGKGYGTFWRWKGRYRVCKGSRASKKSKTTALWYITNMMKYPQANGLAVGDGVILIRQQEGQKFIVVDRIGK